eukprot:258831_1
MSNTLRHLRTLVMLHYCSHLIKACPDGFTACTNGGLYPSSCHTTNTTVIAYGRDPTWAYYEKAGGIDLDCNSTIFGNPVFPSDDRDNQCCKSLSGDLSGVSGLSPVVNTISCGESIRDYFKPGVPSTAHFWKFSLGTPYKVMIGNCDTKYDTTMFIRDYKGDRLSSYVIGCGVDTGADDYFYYLYYDELRYDESCVCDGDDCGCLFPNINEEFRVPLYPGDYYIEIMPYDSVTAAGVYTLSIQNCIPPTQAPTPAPITKRPTTPITKRPTKADSCNSKSGNWFCYDIDLSPSLTRVKSRELVLIINDGAYYTTNVFAISVTIHGNHCVNPSILFSFDEFGLTDSEYINLYDNDYSLIAQCTSAVHEGCGNWIDCSSAPQRLPVDKINKDETYTIYVEESAGLDDICTERYAYDINAKFTISCAGESDAPTKGPTNDPTSDPTNDPTSDPTSDPTNDPTNDPTDGPTSDPTNDPTNVPTDDPTNDPTNDPTTDPTIDPTIDLIATNDPTNDPLVQTRDVAGAVASDNELVILKWIGIIAVALLIVFIVIGVKIWKYNVATNEIKHKRSSKREQNANSGSKRAKHDDIVSLQSVNIKVKQDQKEEVMVTDNGLNIDASRVVSGSIMMTQRHPVGGNDIGHIERVVSMTIDEDEIDGEAESTDSDELFEPGNVTVGNQVKSVVNGGQMGKALLMPMEDNMLDGFKRTQEGPPNNHIQ